jgi:hypothetical protein
MTIRQCTNCGLSNHVDIVMNYERFLIKIDFGISLIFNQSSNTRYCRLFSVMKESPSSQFNYWVAIKTGC